MDIVRRKPNKLNAETKWVKHGFYSITRFLCLCFGPRYGVHVEKEYIVDPNVSMYNADCLALRLVLWFLVTQKLCALVKPAINAYYKPFIVPNCLIVRCQSK